MPDCRTVCGSPSGAIEQRHESASPSPQAARSGGGAPTSASDVGPWAEEWLRRYGGQPTVAGAYRDAEQYLRCLQCRYGDIAIPASRPDPREAKRHYELGRRAAKEGKDAEAVDHFTRALALKTKFPAALHQRAMAHFRQRNFKEALDDLTAELRFEPWNINVLIRRACVHEELKDYASARRDLQTAERMGRGPQVAVALNNLGVWYGAQKKRPEAIAAFSKAIRYDPRNAIIHSNLADMHYHLKQYEDAKREATKALAFKTRPLVNFSNKGDEQAKNMEAFHLRGLVHYALREYPDAISDFTNAIKQGAKDAWDCYWFRGVSLLLNGNLKKAADDLRHFSWCVYLKPQKFLREAIEYATR